MNLDGKRGTAIVFDDHLLFSDTLALTIERFNLFSNVRSFSKISDLLQFLIQSNLKNAVLFADYYLEDTTIASHINHLKKVSRGLRIVIISSITNPTHIRGLIHLEINGIISKNAPLSELKDCIAVIMSGEQYISAYFKSILNTVEDLLDKTFTTREIEIMGFFAKGNTVDKTAELLNLSRHTIAAHRRKMMAKIKCNNITELLNHARDLGLIE